MKNENTTEIVESNSCNFNIAIIEEFKTFEKNRRK